MAAGQQSIAELDARADAAVRHYNRTTWIRFTVTFLPVPLIVVILRLQVDAWAYYLYGAAIVVLTLSMYLLDGAARDRRDAAVRAAEQARLAAAPRGERSELCAHSPPSD